MNVLNRRYAAGLTAVTLLIVSGCGGSVSGDKTGRISLGVSDGPVREASKVCIEFDAIELKGEGPAELVPDFLVQKVNLLEFQGMNAAPLLVNHELPAGDYQWMRLGINAVQGSNGGLGDNSPDPGCPGEASYIVTPDGTFNLYVPSGAENGLKLVGGFTVPSNGSANFTAEFDLLKSVTAPNGLSPDVVLRPTIRLVNNVEVGTLTGEVSSDLATAIVPATEKACEPWVYVFDDGVTPNAIDIDAMEPDPLDPIATAMVNLQTDDQGVESYHYTVGYLLAVDEAGNTPLNYDVAFTCDGETFEPAEGKPAQIFVDELTTVDFP